jgi:allantoicase
LAFSSFQGNYPDSVVIEGLSITKDMEDDLASCQVVGPHFLSPLHLKGLSGEI